MKKEKESAGTGMEVAIIGMAGRFPGAQNIDELWENIKNGVESVDFFSDKELEEAGIQPGVFEDADYVKTAGGVLENKDLFAASFFGYTPKEAELMEPQMRIFHECVWQALEDAGYDTELYDGLIGIYAGASSSSYWEVLSSLSGKRSELGGFTTFLLTNKDFINSRVSYHLDLKGPVFSVHTACSTSLVAVHLGCRALLTGECKMVAAGGITLVPAQKRGYFYQEGMIMSSDGHCRAFDARASGTVQGEGVGIVVMKRLGNAITDGDHIYTVIKGSAINNDGKRKVGYEAPSIDGQAEAIRRAQRIARVEPGTISYIETHGTGTTLGDPVEIEALKLAFNTNKKGFCAIGSVKTNIGHLDSAAGAASLIKTILALKYGQIPPNLHFETPNPKIDFKNSPFYVNSKLTEWKNESGPLRAGVSSFGIGGTNAHVVLEEWPEDRRQTTDDRRQRTDEREYQLILLSAKTRSALDKMTENLAEYFKKNLLNRTNHKNLTNPGLTLADAAYTLQVGRRSFKYRRMLVCSTIDEAIAALSSRDSAKVKIFQAKEEISVIFMFPGLGAQYVNMGMELYQKEPVFREEMDRCFEILKPLMDYDIKEILYPGDWVSKVSEVSGESSSGIETPLIGSPRRGVNQTEIAQPVVFILQYALAKLLIKWGIKPCAMIGYSFGEYTAACLSGIFSLEDALKLIVSRSQLIEKMPTGAMLSVPLRRDELKPLLSNELSIAIDNGPSCIVSGSCEAVESFERQMKEKKYICVRLKASHALHSERMTPISAEFEDIVGQLTLNNPKIPYISNLTGGWITVNDALNPAYWGKHLRQTVRFADGIKELLKESNPVFIEIGPGHDLSVLCRHHISNEPGQVITNLIKHPQELVPDDSYLLNKIGHLWLSGVKIDWHGFYSQQKRQRISLPTYPFERLSYWIEGDPHNMVPGMTVKSSPGKKPDITDWFYIPSWKYSPLAVAPNIQIPKELCWLIFMDETGLGTQLLKRLEYEGLEFVTVRLGENFTRISDQNYTINPGQNNDYNILLKELSKKGKIPGTIIHLWGVTGGSIKYPGLKYIDKVQTLGFYSLMYLAQAIGKQNYKNRVQIAVISDYMQKVTGEETISPGKATILGAVKVIPQEYYNIDCCSMDIIPPGTGNQQYESTIDQLQLEFLTGFPDPVVAYRNNYRWVQIYEPVQLKKSGEKIPLRLKKNGVYLVTGGLGGIGYTIAEYLAKSLRAKLVLTGRSALPSREDWEQWIKTHPPEDKISQKIKKILNLEKLGSGVLVGSADVSHYQQMKGVITTAEKQFGPINGVIHSAGLPDGGVIPLRTREMTDKILTPKVKGTLVLDDALKNMKLDFFIICSSLSSVTGGFGQLGYCAANAFQDAYAHFKSAVNNNITSINWDTWKEVGFGVETLKQLVENNDIQESEAEALLMHAISPAEGMDIFSRIMDYSFPRVIISTRDIMVRNEPRDDRMTPVAAGEPGVKPQPGKLYPRPDLSTEYVIPNTEFEKTCANILQQHFGFEKVGIHDNLFEFGVTSLAMIHINNRLNKELKNDIPLVVMFEFPTIHSLQQYLGQEDMEESLEDESNNLDKEKNLLYDSISIFTDEN